MSELKLVRTQVRIPSAKVKTMVATDVELVPAPGAGKVIVPHFAVVTLDFQAGGVAYAWANSDHGITVGGMAFDSDAEAQALIEASARASVILRPAAGSAPLSENAAMLLAASGTGEPTAGTSDLVIDVQYSVHDVTEGA